MIVGGVRCLEGFRAVCEMTEEVWVTDCVAEP